ncbi:hypothetical protein [Martelella mangrovi]|uniref:Uncharacterized protein n=1 Tax=Martelella mangrovi TaxID=1397477 RepID=A0ABV2I7T3_9HYPH
MCGDMLPLRKRLLRDRKVLLACLMACCGFIIALGHDVFANPDRPIIDHVFHGVLAAIGGFLAGYLFSGLLGRTGWRGWIVSFLGAWGCSAIGGFIAGTLRLPGIGSFFGFLTGAMWFVNIYTGILWISVFVLMQFAAISIRRRS